MNSMYSVRRDCFGYDGKNGCGVLSETLCRTHGECSFFKTKARAQADAERAFQAARERGYYPHGRKYEARGSNDE